MFFAFLPLRANAPRIRLNIHDYRHDFYGFRDTFLQISHSLLFCVTFSAKIVTLFVKGGNAAPPFTFWNTFLSNFVSHFDNISSFVILEHDSGRFRVPFREHSHQQTSLL